MVVSGYSIEKYADRSDERQVMEKIITSVFAWPVVVGEEIYKIGNEKVGCKQ
jgi:hypothetical protein